ncbi:MAG: glycosyltransferase family 2 protein [Bernardetiaceae bacterium]|nr:glycosyltransferase family 2 protein [Bernardetiaceae bacterium]
MPSFPLVSVIAICYGHEAFVCDALEAVCKQDYPYIELLIADDYSPDSSLAHIRRWIAQAKHQSRFDRLVFVANTQNVGNCATFNKILAQARGKYIIDLATDDIMLPQRISKQVEAFEKLPHTYGVLFGNAEFICAKGEHLGFQYNNNQPIPTGDIFKYLLTPGRHIAAPTMMIKRDLLLHLGGYDADLSYEDFDFYVRSSRISHYAYQPEVLTQIRRLAGSHRTGFYIPYQNRHISSTLKICQKAYALCQNQEEKNALAQSLSYYLRQCFYLNLHKEAQAFWKLYRQAKPFHIGLWGLSQLSRIRLPWHRLYRLYRKLTHQKQ